MPSLKGRIKPLRLNIKYLLVFLAILAYVGVFFFWKLDTLTPGLGPDEIASRQASQNTAHIIKEAVNAPYYLLQNALVNLSGNNILGLRLASVLVGLIIIGCLYSVLKFWFGTVVAIFGLLIFAATPWVVLTMRLAGPNIMLLWPAVLLAAYLWAIRAKRRLGFYFFILLTLAALGLYIPGMAWIILACLVIKRQPVKELIKKANLRAVLSSSFFALALIAPLVIALYSQPSKLYSLLLIPQNWSSFVDIIKSVGWSTLALVWQTNQPASIIIDRLPILNVLQIAFLIFGVYALSTRVRRIAIPSIGLLVFSILLSAINNSLYLLTIGLVAIAIFVAAGLRYLLLEWRGVFPLNPFSYALAVGLISLVVIVHLLYGVRYSLIAWPKTEETRATYVLQ